VGLPELVSGRRLGQLAVVDLAQPVFNVTGGTPPITVVPRPEDDPQAWQSQITFVGRVAQSKPRAPIREGMARTVEWFRERDCVRVS
jgi:hypothetical protein